MKITISVIMAFFIIGNVSASIVSMDTLLNAIKKVESQNGKYLNGENGEIGPYQIKKIVIDDVNRILKTKKYSYDDALDENKSREICMERWSKWT